MDEARKLDEQVVNALNLKIEPKVKKEEVLEDEESLNSDDDDSDYDESVNTGNNILLGYYEKTSRK